MNNEEKILQMLASMQTELSGFRSEVAERFDRVETDIAGLKQDVSELKQDVSGLKQDVSGLKQDVSELKQDVSGLKQDVDILKTQQRENTDIIKAIRHNQEHICAEIDALKTHTASAEALAEIKTEIVDANVGVNELNKRLFAQEKEIGKLKLVK